MKNIIFFVTHATLGLDHAKATLKSIRLQNVSFGKKFDTLYVYNTHQEELSNDVILDLIDDYNLRDYIDEIRVFEYDPNTPKNLASDVSAITSYCKLNYDRDDRILILKSDCVLSKNYFETILNLPEGDIFFTAPFICAKKRVTDEEIFEYAQRNKYVRSDEITFFVEDKQHSIDNDFTNRLDVSVDDDSIKFTSCEVANDFSCHFITNWLTRRISLVNSTWGGAKFESLLNYHIGSNDCFVIHKFHEIISPNRNTDREGPVREWLAS